MLFSRVKTSCFRTKAHLVFHQCLYNKKNIVNRLGFEPGVCVTDRCSKRPGGMWGADGPPYKNDGVLVILFRGSKFVDRYHLRCQNLK